MKLRYSILLLMLFLLSGFRFATHDEVTVRKMTDDFFREIFIQNDFDSAYSLLDVEFQKVTSKNDFKQYILQKHAGKRPGGILIYEMELYGGKEVISTFAKTQGYEPQLFYRITFKGTYAKGYKIYSLLIDRTEIKKAGYRKPFDKQVTLKIKST